MRARFSENYFPDTRVVVRVEPEILVLLVRSLQQPLYRHVYLYSSEGASKLGGSKWENVHVQCTVHTYSGMLYSLCTFITTYLLHSRKYEGRSSILNIYHTCYIRAITRYTIHGFFSTNGQE